jgi:exopolyphosphatase/guanosine-5'-triphosphate,3'-diphosphate pyrophosphatase
VVFSGYGLREGLLFKRLSAQELAKDPLIVAAKLIAGEERRFGSGESFFTWTGGLFENEPAWMRRLRFVAALLSDVGWAEHPDYRDERSFRRCLLMPVPGLDHAGRVFLGLTLHARYGGDPEAPVLAPTKSLIDFSLAQQARALGLAFRLAYTLTGGAETLIERTSLRLDGDSVILTIPERSALFSGEAVQRRLEALARALGRRAQIVCPSDSLAQGTPTRRRA